MIRLDTWDLAHAATNGLERLALSLGIDVTKFGYMRTERAYRAALIQAVQRAEKALARGAAVERFAAHPTNQAVLAELAKR